MEIWQFEDMEELSIPSSSVFIQSSQSQSQYKKQSVRMTRVEEILDDFTWIDEEEPPVVSRKLEMLRAITGTVESPIVHTAAVSETCADKLQVTETETSQEQEQEEMEMKMDLDLDVEMAAEASDITKHEEVSFEEQRVQVQTHKDLSPAPAPAPKEAVVPVPVPATSVLACVSPVTAAENKEKAVKRPVSPPEHAAPCTRKQVKRRHIPCSCDECSAQKQCVIACTLL